MTKPHSSDSRKAICAAISSALAKRPKGVPDDPIALNAASSLPLAFTRSWKKGTACQIAVSTPPGAIALTRIWSGAPSLAAIRREVDHRRLGRAISGDARLGLHPGDRGGHDDRAARPAGLDRPHRRLQRQERAVEIGRHHPAPFGQAGLGDRPAGADPGVDHGVGQPGEVRHRPEVLVGDVADQDLAFARQREGEIAQPVLVEIDQDQLLGALLGKAGGDCRANTGGGARHEGDGVIEMGHDTAVAGMGCGVTPGMAARTARRRSLRGEVADAEFAELAIERRAPDPEPPRDLGHAAAIMADREADDVGLDLLERAQIAVGVEQRDAAASVAIGAGAAAWYRRRACRARAICGKSARVSASPSHSTAARNSAFCSWRTLPGQS